MFCNYLNVVGTVARGVPNPYLTPPDIVCARHLSSVHNGVSKGIRGKARVVSVTIPPSKADFTLAAVLKRRAHVPDNMGVRNGRRENAEKTRRVILY